MANILVCADGFFRSFSPFSLEPYIESFINVLARQGNAVLPCILHDFKGSKYLSKIANTYSARTEIDKFSPDLIVAFNNAILPEAIKTTKCPILIVASDSPVFWKEMPFFLAHKDRYKIAFFNSDFVPYLVQELGMSLKDLVLIPYSTDIHAQPQPSRWDVSFIGNFYNPGDPFYHDLLRYAKGLPLEKQTRIKKLVTDIFEEIKANHKDSAQTRKHFEELVLLLGISFDYSQFIRDVFLALTFNMRLNFLQSLLDFDLHIWTWDENLKVLANHYDVWKKCHLEPAASTKENESVYNSSKISLNLPHAQVNTGFSWRVCDILASNAMLLSYPSADLQTLFQGAIPTFLTAQDLRDKVNYYLKNEKERKEIVAFCQNIIQKNHRYENVFSILQEFLHMPLFHEVQGKVVNMRITDKLQKKYLKRGKLK